jgi:glycosyltransferase involved in cell wall biosynthesis
MKIAYVAVDDILNKKSWNKHLQGRCAAAYYISQHLIDESTSINYICPLEKKFAALTRAKWSFYRYFLKKDYYRWAEPLIIRNYARQIEKKLKLDTDIVLCPENIVPIADLECKQPIVLWTDATLSSLINFYRHMENLCDENIKNIYKMEASALERCQLIIYTSEWAAQSAINTYGISSAKIKVIPYGANLDSHRNWEDIEGIVNSKQRTICKLLFIGVDWIRKGGDVALKIAQELNNAGLKTELTVVGCQPITHQPLPEFVRVIEFLDKSQPEGLEKMNKLFTESHFLILPTIADCSPHVFAEANSFGLPSLTTNVGGISTIVKDEINGKVFSLEASIDEYCNYITSMMAHYHEYQKLALSSFREYQERLNWQAAVKNVKRYLIELIQ